MFPRRKCVMTTATLTIGLDMCCVCEESTLGLRNTYWQPDQWNRAVQRAVAEGRSTGQKHQVYSQVFAGGRSWGWKVRPI